MTQRGFREERKFEEEVISVDRISRMTSGGRRLRFRAVVVLGDRKSRVGIGVAKANDVAQAINKARDKAEKSLIDVLIVGGTIPFQIQSRYGGAEIFLKPAAAGTGIIAGGVVRKTLELAGIENVLSKALGSQNKINNLKATLLALEELAKVKNEKQSTKKNNKE
jgi:small subunit ribosomal protein S5